LDVPIERPSTPPQNVRVVIYTPSKTWIPAEERVNSQLERRSHVVESQGEEDDEATVTKATTITRRKRRSSSTDPDYRPVSNRDAKGHFASIGGIKQAARDTTITPHKKRRTSSGTSEPRARSVSRDAKGRFASKERAVPVTPKKRTSADGNTSSEGKPRSVSRDAKGRFSAKKVAAPSSQENAPIARGRRRASSVVEHKPPGVVRDAKGRFSSQDGTVGRKERKDSSAAGVNNSRSVSQDAKGRFATKPKAGVERPLEGVVVVTPKRPSNQPATSGTRNRSVSRDSRGRFSSRDDAANVSRRRRRNSSVAAGSDMSEYRPPRRRKTSTVASNSDELQPRPVSRDAHGRFAPKENAQASVPVTPKKRKNSTAANPSSEKKPGTVSRDGHGRFAPKNHGEISAQDTAPAKKKNSSKKSAETSDEQLRSVSRDAKERFSPKDKADILPEEVDPASFWKKKFRKASEEPSDRQAADQAPEVERDGKGRFAPKLKKPATKSPYFTPPISPEKTDPSEDVGEPSKNKACKKRSSSKAAKADDDADEDISASQKTPKTPRPPGGTVSCIPFPPLSSPHFGLIQEKLARDPFRLLIAVTFLIRTHGKHAIPVFYDLMEKYPTPQSLVEADKEDIVPIIRHLGLQNQRATTYQTYAKIWLEDPPVKGKRYPVRGYPEKESGRDVKKGEIVSDEDERDAWEIGHITQGPYAIDSWRIFCRDALRLEAESWNGEGAKKDCFQPEWMRVRPEDKELRAYLRWMWLKEGFEWDPFTGEKDVARQELMKAAIEGRIAWDDVGGMRILKERMAIPVNTSQVGNQLVEEGGEDLEIQDEGEGGDELDE
jgi:methyl-CpG-binding domain protein 4